MIILENRDAIQVLMQEYNYLGGDIAMRSTAMFQLTVAGPTFFLGVIAWGIINQQKIIDSGFWGWVFFFFVLFVIASIGIVLGHGINRDIGKAAQRRREIEKEVNDRAGETLLQWESRWGGAVTGYVGRAKPLAPSPVLGDSELPPKT